ncbi:hypothetical protein B0H14DRAFT_152719 [Mycena olivaceomarginata]|nr:hypothetical protein B0H14DRAFT_152719 [Mycena olivaceomarginata]
MLRSRCGVHVPHERVCVPAAARLLFVPHSLSHSRRSKPNLHPQKTSYGVQNESVRFYSQALSRLFARPDAAGSLETTGAPAEEGGGREGVLDEVERAGGGGESRGRRGGGRCAHRVCYLVHSWKAPVLVATATVWRPTSLSLSLLPLPCRPLLRTSIQTPCLSSSPPPKRL